MTPLRRAALEASPCPPTVLASLLRAIEINDHIDLDAPVPATVSLDYPVEHLIAGFQLSRQLWRSGVERSALIDLADRVRGGGPIDDGARRWMKEVRARFKHLRFAFYLYSGGHRSPPMLSMVTLIMGELQDALRVKGSSDVRRRAVQLRLLLAAPLWRRLEREVDRLVPSDGAGFRRFTLDQIDSLRPLLATPTVTAHAFHAGRKVVSRQVSFHDDMRTLYGGAEHAAMARWLATLNGLMGAAHDDLVARHAAGGFDYARERFTLTTEIRDRLDALITLYRGTSSSEPPSS